MNWTQVNESLWITGRQRSGYTYRMREGSSGICGVILIAEGPISGVQLPVRREECRSRRDASELAEEWERSQ